MSCNTVSELLMELEDFMDEVEVINKSEYVSASPPKSDWLVHFDVKTKRTIYQHIHSGEERADMPAEYATYLERFNRYMTSCLREDVTKPVPVENVSVRTAEANVEAPSQLSPLRKKRKRSSQIQTESVVLSELIGYSASSDSDTSSEKAASLGPDERLADSSIDMENSNCTGFIGPQLPKNMAKQIVKFKTNHGDHGDAIDSDTNHTAPYLSSEPALALDVNIQHSPVCSPHCSPLHTFAVAKDELEKQEHGGGEYRQTFLSENTMSKESRNHFDTTESKRSRRERKKYKGRHSGPVSHVEDAVEVLKDKFAAFNVFRSEISTLHRLYIQMTTRLEDWRRGKLSSRYFSRRLDELEDRLLAMASDNLPRDWTCHWDTDSGQYYYHNKTTGTSQWSFPGPKQGCTSPVAATSKATIVRPPQLVKSEDTLNTAESNQSNTGTSVQLSFEGPVSQPSLSPTLPLKQTDAADPTPATAPLDTVPTASALPTEDLDKDKEKWLNEQLREFAIACLEFASPTRQDAPAEDRLLGDHENQLPPPPVREQQSEQQQIDLISSNSKIYGKRKKTTSTAKGLSGGGKELPHLMQKWQHLQESL